MKNNDKGILNKYIINKADGTDIDSNAEYFVLRLDNFSRDKNHLKACRKAIRTYTNEIKDYIPKLSEELLEKYPEI